MSVAAQLPLPVRKSLRMRGLAATLLLLAYLAISAFYIAHERAKIYGSIAAMDQLARHEKALALTEAAVSSALVDVSESGNAAEGDTSVPSDLRLYMESCARLFDALDEFDPGYVRLRRAIERSYDTLVAAPVRANWIDLRESLHRASDDFEIRHRALTQQREALNLGYQRQYDSVTVESLALAVVGLVTFGSLAAWFFARLSADVRRLEEHARQIVNGTRGVALEVHREDEIGRLMHAVNRMALDLDEREKQLELEGQRRSHHDKMLAVGALAAGIAHEVNNPLSVIAGVAQELQSDEPPDARALKAGTQLILAQTQRAAQAARQLADVAAPQPAELDWVDLNALLRRVVQLMGYDRRYRRFTFASEIDDHLPAVRSSADAIQQVLMQMLSLACEAIAGQRDAPSQLQLSTRRSDGEAVIEIAFPRVLDFSRREVQRSLLLSRAIVEPLRGRLAFGQVGEAALRIQLTLPVETDGTD